MAEYPRTDAEADDLWNSTDTDTGVFYPPPTADWRYDGARNMRRMIQIVYPVNSLRVFKSTLGDLKYGVRAGQYYDGDTLVDYTATDNHDLTDDDTNYIYLQADGTLVKNTTGFPVPSVTPHLPLAEILTADGLYTDEDITDRRGRTMFTAAGTGGWGSNIRFLIPLMNVRNEDGTIIVADGGQGATEFGIKCEGWATAGVEARWLEGVDAQANGGDDVVVSTFAHEFILPETYVDASNFEVVTTAKYQGTGTAGACTIDVEVFNLDDEGTASVDRNGTGLQAITGAFGADSFAIDGSGSVAGTALLVLVQTSITETGTANPLNAVVAEVGLDLDIKG